MRTWERVPYAAICGGCGATLTVNDMAVYIKIENIKRVRVRCAACEGPAPPELPPLLELHKTTKAMTPIKKLGTQFQGKIWKRG